MDAEIRDENADFPVTLSGHVAIDTAHKILYVDEQTYGHPLLLSWQARNKAEGYQYTVQVTSLGEIVKKRADGLRLVNSETVDMHVRNQAINIICKAAGYGASDIHIMLRGEYAEIQLAVKGGLRVLAQHPQEVGEALIRAIYQGVAETRDATFNGPDFQNAQIPGSALPPEAGLTSVRIVRGPCYPQANNGAFMTLRLQFAAGRGSRNLDLPKLELPRKPAGELRLGKMGYSATQLEKIDTLLAAPNGIIIFTGPTGSGKTTTMFESLAESARVYPDRRLVTVEDPVEYPMDWAVQLPVTNAKTDAETGEAFAERIRVALRMAPHAILCGELRGPQVATSALEAAVTGHQVWTSLHVTDPFLVVDRLELMDPVKLARRVFCDHTIVRGIVAQRLLPLLCPGCCRPPRENDLPSRVRTALSTWGDVSNVRVQGDGCGTCGGDGTLGRIAVAEVVVTDAALMNDFIKNGSEVARDKFRKKPGSDLPMLDAAMAYVFKGEVSPIHVEKNVDLIHLRDRRSAEC
jgi:general secretion pathway protein E